MLTQSTTRIISLLVVLVALLVRAQYVPPDALVEPLKPIGFRISIPHEPGMSLVAFHVNVNERFSGVEAGTIARDVVQQRNGRWTYEDNVTRLKKNDVVHYWVHVDYRGGGYNLLNQQYTVTEFRDSNDQSTSDHEKNRGNNDTTPVCTYSMTKLFDMTGATKHACAKQLIFEDSFKNSSSLKNWTVAERFSGSPFYEFVLYQNHPDNVKVNNGLQLIPRLLRDKHDEVFIRKGKLTLAKCTGRQSSEECQREARGWNILPPVSSGRINTKKSINFAYGRIQIKAKLPHGDWLYPLLLLEPVNRLISSLETLQIRIASSTGNSRLQTCDGGDRSGHILWGGIQDFDPKNLKERSMERETKYNKQLWSDIYHVYELIWYPDRMVLKVDGQIYDEKQVNLPKDTPFYLSLGVAAGGITEFPDNCVSGNYNKTWKNTDPKSMFRFYQTTSMWHKTWETGKTALHVKYVKIWAL